MIMWSYNYTNSDELYHYGVLGMKWGVRRSRNRSSSKKKTMSRKERKAAKKEVNELYKKLGKSGQTRNLVSAAAISTINPKDYSTASKSVVLAKAKVKKNYENKSVDIYIGKNKDPIIRAKMENGEQFSAKFINDSYLNNYNNFMEYTKNNS